MNILSNWRAAKFVFAVLLFAGLGSQVLRSQAPVMDKISGEILAHQKLKQRPAERPLKDHQDFLRRQGLNPENLTAEDCAVYATHRFSAGEIEELARKGIRVRPDSWISPVPGKHSFGFYLATVDYTSLDFIRKDARISRLESTESENSSR